MINTIIRCAGAITAIDQYLHTNQKNSSYIEWLDRYSKQPHEHDDSLLFGMLVQAMFSGGMKGKTVDAWIPKMKSAFFNWDVNRIALLSPAELVDKINSGQVIRNKPKLSGIVSNAKTALSLVQKHQSFGNYLSSFKSLEDLSADLTKHFSYLGEVTTEDFLRNVGFDTLKPDRHLTRWLSRMGVIDDGTSIQQIFDVYSQVADKTGFSRSRIDAAIYLFCADRDDVIDGGICEMNPKCDKCPITKLCPNVLSKSKKLTSPPIRQEMTDREIGKGSNADVEGKRIYREKVLTIKLNRQVWREGGATPGKGDHFRRIIDYNGGKLIPYSFFTEAESACQTLFGNKNVRNYVYFVLKFALELDKLKETPKGLRCVG